MNKCKPVFGVLAVVLTLACAAAAQDGPDVTLKFKFKNVVLKKTEQTSIYGINNSGAMVGYYLENRTGAIHGLLLVNGEVTNIDDPVSMWGTEPISVSSNGT